MEGKAFEPFPRQVLVGKASGTASYYSEIFDSRDWATVTWWLEVYASLPATVTNPVTMYLQTSDDLGPHNWVELIPGGESPTIGTIATGVAAGAGRHLRVRVVVAQGETAAFEVHAVGRPH